jgi:uncharacterized protein (TIGR00369 family)
MESDPRILRDLRARVAASPFHAGLGLRVDEARAGAVSLSLETAPEQRNLQGLVHGGVLATLADMAMGLAVRSAIEEGRRHVTIELGVHYLRPARPGRVSARGETVRVGSQVAFARAEIVDAGQRLLATATGTFVVTRELGGPDAQ